MRPRQDSDDGHHPAIFVIEDMAVIDEVADVGPAEIHSDLYARIGTGAGLIGEIHGIEHLLLGSIHLAYHRVPGA